MSENGTIRPRHGIAAHGWLIAVAILYAVFLGYALTTIGFGAEDSVRQYIARVSVQTSAEPIPQMPILPAPQWRDTTLHRDPFQPIAREAAPAAQQ